MFRIVCVLVVIATGLMFERNKYRTKTPFRISLNYCHNGYLQLPYFGGANRTDQRRFNLTAFTVPKYSKHYCLMPFDNDKTPPRTSVLSDQNHLSNIRMAVDAGPTDEPVVEYPARYSKNEIAELITTNSADNIDLVSLKLGELKSKKMKFVTACTRQETLPNVGKVELMKFEIWKESHVEDIDHFVVRAPCPENHQHPI